MSALPIIAAASLIAAQTGQQQVSGLCAACAVLVWYLSRGHDTTEGGF